MMFGTCPHHPFYANSYYWPQRSCGQGNVFTGVCLSIGGEGVCLSACWDARPPWTRQNPPRTRQTPPGPGRPPLDQVDPPGPGRPPLEPGRHPRTRQTPPGPGRPPPPDQVDHPPDQADPPWARQTPPQTRQTTPPDQADPPPGSRLQHMVYERPVRILLECILVHSNLFVLKTPYL